MCSVRSSERASKLQREQRTGDIWEMLAVASWAGLGWTENSCVDIKVKR